MSETNPMSHRVPELLLAVERDFAALEVARVAFANEPSLDNEINWQACMQISASTSAALARAQGDHSTGFKWVKLVLRSADRLIVLYKRQRRVRAKS